VYIPKLYNGKDKTFFFYSFETGRGSPVTAVLNPTVPLSAWRQGDFGSAVVNDPLTGQPFPGNRIPAKPHQRNRRQDSGAFLSAAQLRRNRPVGSPRTTATT
jgi:hypothetical protein